AQTINLAGVDPSGTQALNFAEAYAIGDPLIVSVGDADQNFDPLVRESISVRVLANASGDAETVILVESGANTGVFVGYVFTTSQISVNDDCILRVTSGDSVSAVYTDPTDGTDVKTTLADISPIGLVFNDTTGERIYGVIVSLIDANTNLPAEVRGDGPAFARYPSSLISGETAQDGAGATYVHEQGEYRFPSLPAGDYRIEIFNTLGWELSDKPDAQLRSVGASIAREVVADTGFILSARSRGQSFHVAQGSLPRIDIPVQLKSRNVPPEALTPSVIEFLQYSANADIGATINVGATECVGGTSPQVAELKNVSVPVPGLVNLVVTRTIKAGQPVFIRVTDLDQNSDAMVREQITVQLDVGSSGDREYLKLMETGVDTGIFVGYVQSAENESVTGSCMLGVVKNESIVSRYTDAFDNTDVADSMVLVDPFGKVFSTVDGHLINGVSVTLVNARTGLAAKVFGDGPNFAVYPSTVVTGVVVTDAAGQVYEAPTGEYRFPFVEAGDYQLVLDDLPTGSIFPTSLENELIVDLSGGPFEIVTGSRGEVFPVPVGPALHVDLPVDEPSGEMFVSKQASKATVAVGDFLQYRLSITNTAGTQLNETYVLDYLPAGFRYQQGSLRINDVKVADPAMAVDARSLKIDLPTVSGDAVMISYVTEVTAGANAGPAVNEARVVGELVATTNVATARVMVTNDLYRDKAILLGQVSLAQCESEEIKSANATPAGRKSNRAGSQAGGLQGIAGVRLFLEDGSYVITDDKGFWHIEGVEPGVHVVQLDVDSLGERYEASPCNTNTRFAGATYSQFVDVKAGTLWRADFKIQEKAPPESIVSLAQTIKVDEEGLWVSLEASNEGRVVINDVSAIYAVPKGWMIVPGSGVLDGVPLSPSSSIVGTIWALGTIKTRTELRFSLAPKYGREIAAPTLNIGNQIAVFRPRFKSRSTVLSPDELRDLDDLIASWQGRQWAEITVVGHTDNVPVASRNRGQFADNNVLSLARAQVVAQYMRGKVAADVITVVGAADRYPIASNTSAAGRAQNRRVEFLLDDAEISASARKFVANAEILNGESKVRLAFRSAGSRRGKTAQNVLPLNRIVSGFDTLNATVTGQAIGSWDVLEQDLIMPLAARDPATQGLISVVEGTRLANRSNGVSFDMDSRLTPKLAVDGVEVASDRIGLRMSDESTGKTLYKYIGVNFGEPGKHQLLLQGIDGFGMTRYEETANVVRVGHVFSIRVKDSSGNIADGTTPIRVQLELRDKDGELIPGQSRLDLSSDSLQRFNLNQNLAELTKIERGSYVNVSADGVVMFNPVSRGGSYRVKLTHSEAVEEFDIFVEPEKRDWIMVGVAEGSVAFKTISGNMQALEAAGLDDERDADGRVAFYAKGQVRGDYVLTLAYDTAKDSDPLQQTIDPSAYYTLYGDRSSVQFDAASQKKLYLKLERKQFYGLFGDFSAGLTSTELSAYSRSFNGFKSEYKGKVFEYNAFAAETNQAFIKDEIRGDGTSGIYRLRSRELLINSEKIRIETRDRFRSEQIIDNRIMTRFVDYNIDYEAGTLFFKEPIFSQDVAFNPTFIIADYEVSGNGSNQLNAGGRLAYKPIEDVEVGITLVTEGVKGRENQLIGTDVEYRINDTTEVSAEIATTSSQLDGVKTLGAAYIAEITHRSDQLDATAYVREQQGGFGLGQQNSSESGTRKLGVEATYELSETIGMQGDVYRQTKLDTGANQDVAATTMNYQGDDYTVTTGLRTATSDAGEKRNVSNQLLLGATYDLLDGRAQLSANADTPLGEQGGVGNFPRRLRVGLDYKLTEAVTLKAQQEFSWGEDQDTQGTRIGLSASLWQGGDLVTSVQADDEENSQRLAAVAGLKQRWEMNDNWSFDFGVDRSQTIKDEQRAVPDLQVTAVYNSPSDNDFTAVTFGSKFRKGAWDWATRVEYRAGEDGDKMNFVSDVIHNLDDGQQLLAKMKIQNVMGQDSDTMNSAVQLGYAYRPEDSRWSLFNRLDLAHNTSNSNGFGLRTDKVVNNMNANYLLGNDTQIALQYGLKYVVDNFDSDQYSGFTDLYGVELRHDLGDSWDVGFQGGRYSSANSKVADYSYGLSFGYTVTRNVWLSMGYNFDGFQDNDFSENEYTSEGVFLKYRFKFDQYSARDLKARFWD
ncbi:MAG: putative repeat protein (TIGR01451 family), partial [Candidatus Paceibacteria bacterium]